MIRETLTAKDELSLAELSAESVSELPQRALMRRRHLHHKSPIKIEPLSGASATATSGSSAHATSITQINFNPQIVNVGGDNNGSISISSHNSNSVSF
jgi:hypothetical protein